MTGVKNDDRITRLIRVDGRSIIRMTMDMTLQPRMSGPEIPHQTTQAKPDPATLHIRGIHGPCRRAWIPDIDHQIALEAGNTGESLVAALINPFKRGTPHFVWASEIGKGHIG